MEKFIISENEAGERIDSFLAKKITDYSRNFLASLIKNGHVLVNDKSIKPSYKLLSGDEIVIKILELKQTNPPKGQDINLNIIYEDDNVIVVNKQPGLVVHPAAGNADGTLVNALIHYFPKIKEAVYQKGNPVSEARPGLVHRLDKDTSGVLIVAKNARAMHSLSRQIQNRTVSKKYLALCFSWPKNETGHLVNYLGRNPYNRKLIAEVSKEKGREAISDYKVLQYYTFNQTKISLIEFTIHTGRTHQIRVQAKSINCPVMGDIAYGSKESQELSLKLNIKRQLLHAKELNITLPGNDKWTTFEAPLPKDFSEALSSLVKRS